MEILDLDRYFEDEALQAQIERAARRERARQAQRLFEQAAHALLGRNEPAAPRGALRGGACG